MKSLKTVKGALRRSHLLIQFKIHNPYDGCHWCWDYAYIHEGEAHFLKMDPEDKWDADLTKINEKSYSGSYGIRFNAERSCKEGLVEAIEGGDAYFYDLNSDKDIKELIKVVHDHDLTGVARRLYNDYDIELTRKCPECGQSCAINEMHSTGYHGDGGIGVVLTDFVCDDCYSLGTCSNCGEYYGQDKLRYIAERGENQCEYCAPKCKMCGEHNTSYSDGICEDCHFTPAYEVYKQELADHAALQHTPTLPGIDITPVTPEPPINVS